MAAMIRSTKVISSRRGRTGRPFATAAVAALLALLGLAGCQPPPPPRIITTTTSADGADANPGDGICEVTVGAGDCSLRAAISEANADTSDAEVEIRYGQRGSLLLGGTDDTNAAGDLDIDRAGRVTVVATSPDAYLNGWNGDAFDVIRGTLSLRGVEVVPGGGGAAVRVRAGAAAQIDASTLRGTGTGVRVEAGAGAVVARSTLAHLTTAISADGPVVVVSSTIVHSWTAAISGSAQVELQSSVLGLKDAGSLCTATVVSHGWNVSDDSTCGLTQATDRTGSPLELLEPAAGATPGVYQPLPTSPAYDAVPSGVSGCPGADQLGRPRPLGSGCEAGAVETVPATTFLVDSGLDEPDAGTDGVCRTAAGTCTLRAAVAEANADADRNVIVLQTDVTTTRAENGTSAGGSYDITQPVELDGGGHTISGGDLGRVLTTAAATDIHDVTLTDGRTTDFGGGLAVFAPTTVDRSTIRGNQAAAGGGISVSSGANLTLTASTVTDNTTTGGSIWTPDYGYLPFNAAGGGLYADDTTLVVRSTFTGNYAVNGSAISSGVLFYGTLTHVVTVRSATIVDNNGGPAVERTSFESCSPMGSCSTISGGTIRLSGSALSNPSGSCLGVTDLGSNVGCTSGAGAPLGLGPLQDNGGPTQTFLPEAGSPLLDVIPPGTAGLCDATTPTDQRGAPRPVGAGCDVGSVEQG